MPETRSVVVTGASRGLGLASAAHLYRLGWRVVGAMRSPEAGLERLRAATGAPADDPRLVGIRLDLDDPPSIAAAAEAIERAVGAPDVLVHKAGITAAGSVEEMPSEAWERLLRTNLFGPMRLTKHLLPSMQAAGRGRIVVVSIVCCSSAIASCRAASSITCSARRCSCRARGPSRAAGRAARPAPPSPGRHPSHHPTRGRSMPETPTVRFESRMLIDGELVDGRAGTFTSLNPATEDVLGEVANASAADMQRAIAAARRAFDETDWSSDRALRKRCLLQLHAALEAEKEELREELILDAGCPRAITYGPQLDAPLADALTYPARLIDEYPWETDLGDAVVSLTGINTARKIWREPVGVVGAIVPWNFPFEVSIHKLAQALATGNTLVLKPAPDTPFTATRLGRLIAERTDVPPGVVNVVTASDHLVGEELTLSPQVDMISFTGSTATGRRIMEKGAGTMKRLFLELGGKSATIVLEDADLSQACGIGIAPCVHAGQGCAIPTRLLLPRSRYDEGVALLEAMYQSIAPGDPQDMGTLCGPVISGRQRSRIVGYIQRGIDAGARLLVGGTQPPPGRHRGFWVRPTLFVDVDNAMTIAQEEIFGPVLVVIPYDDEEHAVRIANDSVYGLAGNVMSSSLEHGLAVARRLRAGFIGVNGAAAYGADVPFGGYKASGVGRQNGHAGFDQYTEVKSVGCPVS